jgi:hypothetical protein
MVWHRTPIVERYSKGRFISLLMCRRSDRTLSGIKVVRDLCDEREMLTEFHDVRGPSVRRISLLQLGQLPVLPGDGAPTQRGSALALGDAIKLRLGRGVIVGDFLARLNVTKCDVDGTESHWSQP